jgi:uncharacterized protein (DUF488 family)
MNSHRRTIWTIGHSNREYDYFLSMLAQHSITCVADVRRFPGSRRQPQYGCDELEQALQRSEIEYRHFPGLGGRRTGRTPDSPNMGWRVEAFNAYADHMRSNEFHTALADLENVSCRVATAIMCAEAVPWRCHRRLIADALVTRGWAVWDIFAPGRTKEHHLTKFALVDDGQLIYPAPADSVTQSEP